MRNPVKLFFPLAALIASIIPILTSLNFAGIVDLNTTTFTFTQRHVLEMLFSFPSAVFTGFLLMSSFSLNSFDTSIYKKHNILALLWIFERIVSFINVIPPVIQLPLQSLFLIFAGLQVFIQFKKVKKEKYMYLLIFSLFLIAKEVFLYGVFYQNEFCYSLGIGIAVDTLRLLFVYISTKMFSCFIKMAASCNVKSNNFINPYAITATAMILFRHLFSSKEIISAIYLLALVLNFIRFINWDILKGWTHPAVGSLKLGFLGILIHMLFSIISIYFPNLDFSFSILHIFTLSALGSLVLSFVLRLSLANSNLVPSKSKYFKVSYILILTAIIFRAVMPILFNGNIESFYIISAICFSVIYLVYIIKFIPKWYFK